MYPSANPEKEKKNQPLIFTQFQCLEKTASGRLFCASISPLYYARVDRPAPPFTPATETAVKRFCQFEHACEWLLLLLLFKEL